MQRLAEAYYAQWDTDSVFIYADEAIRFAQQHKLNNLSILCNMLIHRYPTQEKTLKALYMAEEACEEAKALEDHFSKARYRIKKAVHLLATLDKTKYPIEEIGVMSDFTKNLHK